MQSRTVTLHKTVHTFVFCTILKNVVAGQVRDVSMHQPHHKTIDRGASRLRPEDELQKKVVEHLLTQRWIVCFNPAGGPNREVRRWQLNMGYLPGWPDLTCISPSGGVLFLEIKPPRKYLSDHQELVHDTLRQRGVDVCVVRSLADLKTLLAKRRRPHPDLIIQQSLFAA